MFEKFLGVIIFVASGVVTYAACAWATGRG